MEIERDQNPLGLEAGKFYWMRYLPAKNSPWKKLRITHFTVNGHPWAVGENTNGIISPGYYEKKDVTPETELVAKAREFLTKNNLGWMSNNSNFPELFAEFYNTIGPKD